jgi:hypothetical protein
MQIRYLTAVLITLILACGCVGQTTDPQPVSSVTPTPTTGLATIAARPTICHMEGGAKVCLYTDMPPVAAKTPTMRRTTPPIIEVVETVPTNEGPYGDNIVETISGPMEAPITLSGVGNEMVWFDTQEPGVVNFKIRYGGPQYVKNCEEDKLVVTLAGASIDTTLVSTGSGSYKTLTRSFNLLPPGRYSLSVKGCYEWQITVS